jgi:hypothetical protein
MHSIRHNLFAAFTILSASAFIALGGCTPITPGSGTPSSSSASSAAAQADTPYTDPKGNYTVTIPAGWYAHDIDTAVVFTPSAEFTLPEGTEGYAIGQQFIVREARLGENADADTFEEWMDGNGMAPGSEWLRERTTVMLGGRPFERVIMRAAQADGESLFYIHQTTPDRFLMLSHYPYVQGSDESDAFEEFVASVQVTGGDSAASMQGGGIPHPAAQAARMALGAELSVSAMTIEIVSVTPHEWSDSCLGLGGPAESCAMMITPGYEVTLRAGGQMYVYRTNEDGTAVRRAP